MIGFLLSVIAGLGCCRDSVAPLKDCYRDRSIVPLLRSQKKSINGYVKANSSLEYAYLAKEALANIIYLHGRRFPQTSVLVGRVNETSASSPKACASTNASRRDLGGMALIGGI